MNTLTSRPQAVLTSKLVKAAPVYSNEDIVKHVDEKGQVFLYADVAEYNKAANEENIKNILKNVNIFELI